MAIKRWNANTSQWELVGTPGTVTPGSIGAAALASNNTFTITQTIQATSSSSVGLDVYQTDTSSLMKVGFDNASGLAQVGNWSNNPLRFLTNATERMRIDASGNIGIGTSSPATSFLDSSGNNVSARLIDVQPGSNYGGIVVGNGRSSTSGGTLRQGYFVRRADAWNTSRAGMWKGSDSSSSALEYWERLIINNDGGDASIVFATNLTERMRILTDGNVNIASGKGLYFQNPVNTGSGSIYCPGGGSLVLAAYNNTNIQLYEDSEIYFKTSGGTDRMRINSSGYLLVGYTSSNGAYRLQVNSQIFATSSSIATSDGRYKENVFPISSGLDIIDSLNPVSFNWKAHPVHNFVEGKTVGFIAQEVKEALKDYEWVDNIIKTNTTEAVLDEEGNEITPAEEFLGIAESNIIPLLVAAVKELRAELNALKSSMV